jgi:hypothetical protein
VDKLQNHLLLFVTQNDGTLGCPVSRPYLFQIYCLHKS